MPTPSASKLETIERFFAAYAAQDGHRMSEALADDVEWTIPGHHPLAGTKRGSDEVRAFFDALASAGFRAETFFLEANDEYVVDIHRGYSTQGTGAVDTTWALIWHFDDDGRSTEWSTCPETSTRWTPSSGRTIRWHHFPIGSAWKPGVRRASGSCRRG